MRQAQSARVTPTDLHSVLTSACLKNAKKKLMPVLQARHGYAGKVL